MELLFHILLVNSNIFKTINMVVFPEKISSTSEEKIMYTKSQFDTISYGCARHAQLYSKTSSVCDKFIADQKSGIIIIDDNTDQ